MKIEVAIELIIPDNTAFTVLTALRDLGYAQLERVERFEAVFLTVSDDSSAPALIADLAKAEVLFNPNKHRLSYTQPGAPEAQPPQFEAFVRDRDENNDRLLDLLRSTFGMSSLQAIGHAAGWRLYERGASSSVDRLEWACTALLSNPVSQSFEIRRRPIRAHVGGPESVAAKMLK